MRINANPRPTGRMPVDDLARRGSELEGVLGVDAALDGMAAQFDIALAEPELFAGGDADLGLDDVDAGDQFSVTGCST
jgi:hypothetical protein